MSPGSATEGSVRSTTSSPTTTPVRTTEGTSGSTKLTSRMPPPYRQPGKRTADTATAASGRPRRQRRRSQMPASLQGKVALVTGSSSGIGAATARALAAEGAAVVVNSASSVEAGRALAAELPGASYVQADIADADAGPGPRGPGRRRPRAARHPRQQRRHHPGHRPPRPRGGDARGVAAHLRRERHRHLAGDGGRRPPSARRRRRRGRERVVGGRVTPPGGARSPTPRPRRP